MNPAPAFAVALLVALFLASGWSASSAQSLHAIYSNCRADVEKFCANIKHSDTDAIKQCLISYQAKLSEGCKAIFPKR